MQIRTKADNLKTMQDSRNMYDGRFYQTTLKFK